MIQAYDKMVEFHEANGAFIRSEGTTHVPDDVPVLRARLILEEFAETVAAIHETNLIEVADGLTDLTYVLVGTVVSYYDESLLCGISWPTRRPSPEEGTFFFDEDESLYAIQLLTPGVANVVATLDEEPNPRLRFMLDHALWVVHDVAKGFSLPLEACFNEVHRSNMTKNLGNAGSGRKYGDKVTKGETYSPPDLASVLRSVGHEV